MRWLMVVVVLGAGACAKKPEQSKLPNGEASGHEMPEPVDDGVRLKTDEQPEQPDLDKE
jgi:hypothetical protein